MSLIGSYHHQHHLDDSVYVTTGNSTCYQSSTSGCNSDQLNASGYFTSSASSNWMNTYDHMGQTNTCMDNDSVMETSGYHHTLLVNGDMHVQCTTSGLNGGMAMRLAYDNLGQHQHQHCEDRDDQQATLVVAPVRTVKRRYTANRKERRRTLSINNAFADLRDCIPNVPADTKLSKIKTLRLATSYIAYLMDILAKDDPSLVPEGGFKAEVNKKIETREEKKKREMASLLGSSGVEKRTKGRTGWPQHVWALELKQ